MTSISELETDIFSLVCQLESKAKQLSDLSKELNQKTECNLLLSHANAKEDQTVAVSYCDYLHLSAFILGAVNTMPAVMKSLIIQGIITDKL